MLGFALINSDNKKKRVKVEAMHVSALKKLIITATTDAKVE